MPQSFCKYFYSDDAKWIIEKLFKLIDLVWTDSLNVNQTYLL